MRSLVACVACLMLLPGCSSFLHFADPTAQAVTCGITSAVLPMLEGIAATWGVPLDAVERLYAAACGEAAARGLSQHDAESYGVAHARVAAMRMAQERQP